MHDKAMHFSQNPNQACSVIGAGLCLHEILPIITELIHLIWPTNQGPDNNIRIWIISLKPIIIPLSAPNKALVLSVRFDGPPSVVHPLRVPQTIPNQVAHGHRISSQDVINLRFSKCKDFFRTHLANIASQPLIRGSEMIRVDTEKECCIGHILHVVPLAGVQ
ncbi:hypothetical protein QUC31_001726 [Theobroma cacao]